MKPLLSSAPNAMSFHGLGVTEHSYGTYTVMLIADLAMITAYIGKRGVGVNPLGVKTIMYRRWTIWDTSLPGADLFRCNEAGDTQNVR